MADEAKARSESELLDDMLGVLEEMREDAEHPAKVGKPSGNPVQLRPAFPSADDLNQRWVQGVQRNADRWIEGVRRPRANFREQAIERKDAWKTGVQQAVQEDRYAQAMQQVDEDLAISIAEQVGSAGYTAGVTARAEKHRAKMARAVPLLQAAVDTVRRKPANTEQEREQRAIEMIRAFRNVGKALRSGR